MSTHETSEQVCVSMHHSGEQQQYRKVSTYLLLSARAAFPFAAGGGELWRAAVAAGSGTAAGGPPAVSAGPLAELAAICFFRKADICSCSFFSMGTGILGNRLPNQSSWVTSFRTKSPGKANSIRLK